MKKTLGTFATVLAAATASAVFAHAKLQQSEPGNGSTVTTPPAALKLHYNEPVEPAVSGVKLFGPGDKPMQAGRPALADGNDKTLVVPLPRLPAGNYRVEWSTMGRDGHPMKGDVRFTVK